MTHARIQCDAVNIRQWADVNDAREVENVRGHVHLVEVSQHLFCCR